METMDNGQWMIWIWMRMGMGMGMGMRVLLTAQMMNAEEGCEKNLESRWRLSCLYGLSPL